MSANNSFATDRECATYCKRVLRVEMVKRGLTYKDLTTLLNVLGLGLTEKSVTLRVTRGTFRFTFFLQAMAVMGAQTFTMDIPRFEKKEGGLHACPKAGP
jgi:hypothetical protein